MQPGVLLNSEAMPAVMIVGRKTFERVQAAQPGSHSRHQELLSRSQTQEALRR